MKPSALLLPCILVAAGCASTDPLLREGLWRPNDSNSANLRTMVAVPADLAVAAPSNGGSGQQAAAALDRLRHDRARPLPDSAIAKVGPTGGSPPPQTSDSN